MLVISRDPLALARALHGVGRVASISPGGREAYTTPMFIHTISHLYSLACLLIHSFYQAISSLCTYTHISCAHPQEEETYALP